MTQPRRQDRAVLAVAGVVLVVALAGAVLLLTRDDDPPSPAPQPRSEQVTASPTAGAPPTAAPTTTAGTGPTPAGPTPAGPTPAGPTPTPLPAWDVEEAYLSPDAAGAAEQPGWRVEPDHVPDPSPVLDPCRTGSPPRADAVAAQGERLLQSTRDSGGSTLLQEVLRYAREDDAAAAFARHLADVADCPQAPAVEGPAGSTLRYEVVERSDDDGVRSALVQLRPCTADAGCLDTYRSYVLLAQSADGLTAAFYGLGEDGDPRQAGQSLLEAVADRLTDATG
jgi:hypothetical protein